MLAAYNQVFAGCAERILAMAESQSAHRQDLEKAVVLANVSDAKRGQNYAFILGLAAILCGSGLIAIGRTVEALLPSSARLARWLESSSGDDGVKRRNANASARIQILVSHSFRPA